MRTIWKHLLDFRGWTAISVAKGAKVVHVGLDPASGGPAIWIEHDPDTPFNETETRRFGIFPTGGSIAADGQHVGSIIDRSFVWHVYEQDRG